MGVICRKILKEVVIFHHLFFTMNMRKAIRYFVIAALSVTPLHSIANVVEEGDSSHFITASLLTASPADAVYSSFGHSVIRMQCPSEKLDYCFTFEIDISGEKLAEYFTGNAKAALVGVETPEFLSVYGAEGRGVVERELNLSHHEKQLLWKNLDEELMKAPHLSFNFLTSNCVTATLLTIENSLISEHIEWGKLPAILNQNNGDVIRYNCSNKWYEFLFMTFFGAASDGHLPTEMKLSPAMLADALNSATIVGDSIPNRPVFTGAPHTLLPIKITPTPSPVTPAMTFGILLCLVIFITIMEWFCEWNKLAKITDILLLVVQTIAGLVLAYTSIVANIFGTHWNWYLIPANPLPAILWIIFHKNRHFYKIYLIYFTILVLFICMTPFLSQLDYEHQYITAAFAVRCFSKWKKGER